MSASQLPQAPGAGAAKVCGILAIVCALTCVGIPLAITAFIMYLPFFVGFDSQAGGILPNFMWPTRGTYLWIMWGTLFIPLFAYLIYLWLRNTSANWRTSLITTLGIVAILFVAMFAISFLALKLKPELVKSLVEAQQRTVGTFIADSMTRRLQNIGGLLTLLALLIPTFAFLFNYCRSSRDDTTEPQSAGGFQSTTFVLLLMGLGGLLILGPDFLYLRDNFGYRINTVFKFYYQAWIMLSLAAAFAVAVMLSELRGIASALYGAAVVIVIGLGLVYPVFSLPNKTDDFKIEHPEQRIASLQKNVCPCATMNRIDPAHGNYYRPLLLVWFLVNYSLFAGNPAGFHARPIRSSRCRSSSGTAARIAAIAPCSTLRICVPYPNAPRTSATPLAAEVTRDGAKCILRKSCVSGCGRICG